MVLLPKIKLKTLPTFPSVINGGAGIEVVSQNGALTVDLDYSDFGSVSATPASPTNHILTYDTATSAYVMIPTSLLGGAVSGIADAPNNGLTYARQSASWVQLVASSVSIVDFGAVGDGVTVNTTAIQAAFNSGNPVITVPAGVFMTSSVTVPSNTKITGTGTIRRVNNDVAIGFLIDISSSGFVTFNGITVDGNKANNTQACYGLIGSGTGMWAATIENCTLFGNKIGSTITFQNSSDNTKNTITRVKSNTIYSGDDKGIFVQVCDNITIEDNIIRGMGGDGIGFVNLVYPPAADVHDHISVINNHCLFNTGSGIVFLGYYTGGAPGLPIAGVGVPPQRFVLISKNFAMSNSAYGICAQGRDIAITDNVCRDNGRSANYGGINVSTDGAIISNNIVEANYAWGIDVGGSVNSSICGNFISFTGAGHTSGATGLNIGGTTNCIASHNVLQDNYDSTGVGNAIVASGIEAGGGYFPNICSNLTLSNNKLTNTGGASTTGIFLFNGTDQVNLIGNTAVGFPAGKAFVLESGSSFLSIIARDNVDWSYGGVVPTIAAAATLVIPDIGEYFLISAGPAPVSIYSAQANIFLGRVSFVQMINRGSGYNPASPPSVSFSGGGGSGVAGTALVTNAGQLIGVNLTNTGSNYTAAPTVAFSGSGGSGAVGTAIVGCNNFTCRVITLFFEVGMTIISGGNLRLSGNFIANASGGSTLTLRGSFGAWYEVGRAV